jgi:hypothetical protein
MTHMSGPRILGANNIFLFLPNQCGKILIYL